MKRKRNRITRDEIVAFIAEDIELGWQNEMPTKKQIISFYENNDFWSPNRNKTFINFIKKHGLFEIFGKLRRNYFTTGNHSRPLKWIGTLFDFEK